MGSRNTVEIAEKIALAAGNSAQIARDLDVAATEMQQIVSAYRLKLRFTPSF